MKLVDGTRRGCEGKRVALQQPVEEEEDGAVVVVVARGGRRRQDSEEEEEDAEGVSGRGRSGRDKPRPDHRRHSGWKAG